MSELGKEREDRKDSRQREEHGQQGLPSVYQCAGEASLHRDGRAKHRSTKGSTHDEDTTECQQEMRRTEDGLQVHLEAEEGVPPQVADASHSKQWDTQQRDRIFFSRRFCRRPEFFSVV